MRWLRNTNVDFINFRKKAYLISGILILIGLFFIIVIRGGLNFGIDFDGGIKMQIKFENELTLDEQNMIRKELNVNVKRIKGKEGTEIIIEKKIPAFSEELSEKLIKARTAKGSFKTLKEAAEVIGLKTVQMNDFKRIFTVQVMSPPDLNNLKKTSETSVIAVDSEDLNPELMKINLNTANKREIKEGIADLMTQSIVDSFQSDLKTLFEGKDDFLIRETTLIGPKVGKELRKTAFVIIIFALIGLLVYISLRFELKYAIGAILALIHDILITIGVFALLNKEFNIPIIAAILTIIGYSLNDTIVIYDRIRETLKTSRHKKTYEELINYSINQTLSRTFLTSLTTFMVVLAIFIWGGEALHNFSFALMIGIITG
ncbi:protein translocase subunit SecF, partial [Candidatus Dependentiae bacterium]|nr:protein translocase subunit SecF [Candidatus Dependentiae bacterium]